MGRGEIMIFIWLMNMIVGVIAGILSIGTALLSTFGVVFVMPDGLGSAIYAFFELCYTGWTAFCFFIPWTWCRGFLLAIIAIKIFVWMCEIIIELIGHIPILGH